MKISPDEVRHIASLAKLELSEEEVEKYAKDLGEIAMTRGGFGRDDGDKTKPAFPRMREGRLFPSNSSG